MSLVTRGDGDYSPFYAVALTWDRDVLFRIYLRASCYSPQRSWSKVIFSEVCVKSSVHGGACWDTHRCPAPGTHTAAPPRDQRQTPQEQTPPSTVHAGSYGQQAGGTHPTGMHPCLVMLLISSHILSHRHLWNSTNVLKMIWLKTWS